MTVVMASKIFLSSASKKTRPVFRGPTTGAALLRQHSFFSTTTSAAASSGERVVVLGSGWGGFQLALNMKGNIPLTVVSPNNHFVFTPLLPSASVGTLECRCIQEPVRTILGPQGTFVHASAQTLDTEQKLVHCESVHQHKFTIEYDKLVIAVGVQTNTFGIPSIQHDSAQGIFFLKQLAHARAIRTNIIDSFEKAAIPTVTEAERRRLLSFLVVGGGPTSCEFTSELHGTLLSWYYLWR